MNKSGHESEKENAKAYWRENITLMLILLGVWFTVSFGMGILFIDELDKITFLGFKFGFWVAQQGAIFVFVILIFIYTYKMNKLDRKYGVDEDDDNYVEDDDYYRHDESFIDSISDLDNKGGK
ncbi:hypothetical protein MNBD_ALPHA03-1209 [hydrothermal vent metagenome]|uniref:Sodium symporter small subunit domain-containing protein n=1 Tax=hydrothermal vent metagenome TaxID=652676 RepID=A0A3B1AJI0_9ZZZZ